MGNVARPIPEQHKLSIWLGAYLTQLSSSMLYLSLFNLVMLAATVWNTGLEKIRDIIPWVNFPIFVFGLLAIGLFIPLLHHKFIARSMVAFTNWQGCQDNPVMDKLNAIEQRIDKLENRIKENAK